MSGPTKAELAEREAARQRLLSVLKPGDTVCTVLRHCSKSGMLRVIDLVYLDKNGRVYDIGWNAAKAMGDKYDMDRNGIRIGGCGMDMGFALVYNLGQCLFPKGFKCINNKKYPHRCPSNDHCNREDNKHHNSGGYALKHRWL